MQPIIGSRRGTLVGVTIHAKAHATYIRQLQRMRMLNVINARSEEATVGALFLVTTIKVQ